MLKLNTAKTTKLRTFVHKMKVKNFGDLAGILLGLCQCAIYDH